MAKTTTKSTSVAQRNLAVGTEILGCHKVEATLLHRCYPKVALVHPGVDKVGAEGTGGMVAEDVWGEEACHNEPNAKGEQHCPPSQVWCLKNPSCIVLLGS
jgi:hypothetical protein